MRVHFPKLVPDSEDFLHLDALRIIASLAVVMFHWRAHLAFQPAIDATDWLNSWIVFVDLFFVISGFIIAAVYSQRISTLAQYGDFLFKRFARLAPLHYVTLALYIGIGLLATIAGLSLNEPAKYDPTCIAPNLFFLQAFNTCPTLTHNFPSWSISAEVLCYALFPSMVALLRIRPWLPGAFGVAVIGGLYALGAVGPMHRPWFEWTFDFGALRALPAFAIGVSMYGLRDKLKWIPAPGALMFVSLVALAFAGLAKVWQGALTPLAYLVVIFGIAADARGRATSVIRAIAPFGQLTYSSYMLHAPMMTIVFTLIFDRALGLAPLHKFIAVLACLPLLLAISYLSFVIFEGPIRRWMTRRNAARAGLAMADASR